MNRTQPKRKSWKVVDPAPDSGVFGLLAAWRPMRAVPPGLFLVPPRLTVETEVDGAPVLLDFEWHPPVDSMKLVAIRSGKDKWGRNVGLPVRATRAVAPQSLVVDVLSEVARYVVDSVRSPSGWEPDAAEHGPAWDHAEIITFEEGDDSLYIAVRKVKRWEAEALALGRSKAQVSVRKRREQAKAIAEELLTEGVRGRELYERVAAAVGVKSPTTAYHYLRDAGVIGKKGRQR